MDRRSFAKVAGGGLLVAAGGGLVRPGVGVEIIEPGIPIITAAAKSSKQEHLVAAQVGHRVAPSRWRGSGRCLVCPVAGTAIIEPGIGLKGVSYAPPE